MSAAAPLLRHDSLFLQGGGQCGEIIAGLDWSATPLGPLDSWHGSLKMAVALILRSPAAMVLLWGADGVLIYNDAYSPIAGDRHPSALGSKVRVSWPEVADFNDHVIRAALAGQSLTYRDQEFTLHRNGHAEQVWLTLDYSPVLGEGEQPAGAIAVVVETTEKVLATNWLKAERERLQQMFEQAPGFMVRLRGPQHVFDLVNPAYLQLIGHREVIGRPVREALPDLAGQGFYELLDQVYSSGETLTGTAVPIQLQRSAGAVFEQRFIDIAYQPVRDADGTVLGVFAQGSDVTDRVTAERELHDGEVRNRQILDSAIDYAIIAFDLQGRVTRWNEGAHRILGWTEADMLGQDGSRFFTLEDRAADRLHTEMRRALITGVGSDERWHLRRSGERFWANGEMTPIRNDAGQATGFVKVLRDRTDQHRAAEALRQSEQQLRRAQQAGGVGTFTVDMDSNVLLGTPEFYKLYGLEAAAGMPAEVLEALVIAEDAELVSNAERRRSRAAPLDVEYRIRRASDGALRWIARKAEFETDADGRLVRMVGAAQDVTDRKAAQRALEESAAQFRTFAQTLPSHVWTAPPDGRLDWFNDRVYDYTGVAYGGLDGDGWHQIIHAEDLAATATQWRHSLATGRNFETEYRVRRADGVYLWHLVRAVPIRAADGVISRWVGTSTDIHERKLAETESTRARDRIWTLSQELMMICDLEGRIAAVNPSAQRLLGWTEAEMVGELFSSFLHPDDLRNTAAELVTLGQGATTLAFENRYRARDGSYVLLDWAAVPDGGYIHAVARNITGERAAAVERERIWSSTNDLMATTTADGTLRSVNPAWSRLLGHDETELVGRPFFDVVDAEGRAALATVAEQMRQGTRVKGFELQMRHKDGRQSLVAWTAERLDDVSYLVGRNVTEQRATEDALRQSQKMEAVGQLTGGIAHDFNNLLQGITGSLSLVQKRIGQGRVAEVDRFIGDAMNSARRAAALTHRLLAFSRRQPLDPRPVEVNPLASSMADLLRRTLGESIELRMSLDEDLWTTRCDPNQLENAILNLTINARDAMPDGGVLVISTANVSLDRLFAASQQGVEPGHYVCISVTDTGTGMSEDTVAKAFEPFFTTKPIGQGTGLGLSMIYGFARQSEGHANIYSELGRGTTFKLYLPRHRGDVHAEEPLPALSEQHLAQSSETVLVVEDEPVVRSLIVETLGELGYRTLEAADGPAGLQILQTQRRIDLLITDIGLPGLNGRQIAEAGRLLRPDLKVLFMTGYAENAVAASGFLEHGMAMVTKPFAMEVLATRIREVLPEA